MSAYGIRLQNANTYITGMQISINVTIDNKLIIYNTYQRVHINYDLIDIL